MSLLIIAYLTLISKRSFLFVPINLVASMILTLYAALIKDIPFIIVNGMVSLVLAIKLLKKSGRAL